MSGDAVGGNQSLCDRTLCDRTLCDRTKQTDQATSTSAFHRSLDLRGEGQGTFDEIRLLQRPSS
jgi:hypothetical protein